MQAIRVVTRLENRYAEHDGLNLTWETLEGILKHNGPLVDADDRPVGRYVRRVAAVRPRRHPGQRRPDAVDLRQPRSAGRRHRRRHRLQCPRHRRRPARRADRASTICATCRWSARSCAKCSTRWPDIERSRQAHEVQRRLITRSIEDVIATSAARHRRGRRRSPPTTCATPGRTLVRFSTRLAAAEQGLKRFLFERRLPQRSRDGAGPPQRGAWSATLFDRYIASARHARPLGRRRRGRADRDAARARIVADFIAGMTDPYALERACPAV